MTDKIPRTFALGDRWDINRLGYGAMRLTGQPGNFVGKPCPPSRTGPPCDGPYPNYEVVIYEKDEKNIVNKIMTDDQGNFEVQLPVGNYLVFGKNLDFNKIIEIPIVFTIESEQTKSIEITINEGIR